MDHSSGEDDIPFKTEELQHLLWNLKFYYHMCEEPNWTDINCISLRYIWHCLLV